MAQQIDDNTMEHLAELSRLKLTNAQAQEGKQYLQKMLVHIDTIHAIPTQDVQPLTHPVSVKNVMRADVVQPSLDRQQLLAGAPRHKDGCFAVPKTVG